MVTSHQGDDEHLKERLGERQHALEENVWRDGP